MSVEHALCMRTCVYVCSAHEFHPCQCMRGRFGIGNAKYNSFVLAPEHMKLSHNNNTKCRRKKLKTIALMWLYRNGNVSFNTEREQFEDAFARANHHHMAEAAQQNLCLCLYVCVTEREGERMQKTTLTIIAFKQTLSM